MNFKQSTAKKSIYIIYFVINFLITLQLLIVASLQEKIAGLFPFSNNLKYWISDAYLIVIFLALFIFLLLIRDEKQIISRRKFFQEGIVLFSLGSLICYFANSFDLFVFGRIVQGIGAGMVIYLQLLTSERYLDSQRLRLFSGIAGIFIGLLSSNYIFSLPSVVDISAPLVIFRNNFIAGFVLFIFATRSFQELILSNLTAFVTKYKKRLATIGIGITANQTFMFGFDFLLYPFVIWKFGFVRGYVIMAILSAGVCYALILVYDWLKKDWLGIEALKQLRQFEGKGAITRFFVKLFKKNDFLIFLFLSTQFDPFIAVVYIRQGAHQYNGLSRREWKMFALSLLVGDLYWAIVTFSGVSIIEYLIKILS